MGCFLKEDLFELDLEGHSLKKHNQIWQISKGHGHSHKKGSSLMHDVIYEVRQLSL